MRAAAALVGGLSALAYLALPSSPTAQTAALVIALAMQALLAFPVRRLRGLLLADTVVVGCLEALWLGAPANVPLPVHALVWLGHAGIVVLLVAAGARSERVSLRDVYWTLMGFSLVGMMTGLLLLPAHFSLLALLLILWAFGALPLVGAALLGSGIPMPGVPRTLWIVPIAAGCLVSVVSVRAFPNFSATDEAILFDYVDTFERTGSVGSSLIPYDQPILTGNLYVYAASVWLKLFPGDPFALRNFSALGGIALIAVVFLTARALDGAVTGWMAAALLATNLLWLAVSHVGRQEVWLAVFVWAAVGLSLQAQKRQSAGLALLAGIVVALSADVHPLGAYACIALGIWWLLESAAPHQRRLLRMFVIGGLAGAVYYVGAHVLPDPARFFAALRAEAVGYGAEGWSPLAAMLARHLNYLVSNPLELCLLLVCAALGVRYAKRLGAFVGTLIALYASTVADPNLYYPILWITGMVILAAVGLRHAAGNWRAPLLVALAGAFALNVGLIGRHMSANWNGRALDSIQQVAARVPEGRGTGETFVYLALRDPTYVGFTYVNFRAAETGVTRGQVVEMLKPDWIVTMQDEAPFAPEFNVLSVDVPHMKLKIPDAALATRYHLQETVATSVGSFEIWRRSE